MTDAVEDATVDVALDVAHDAVSQQDGQADAAGGELSRSATSRARAAGGTVLGGVRTIALAFLAAFTLRVLVLEPFHIPSESMEPTLYPGDTIGALKFVYGWSAASATPVPLPHHRGRALGHDPRRGDVIVFRNELDGGADYVKRVIGLPGDEVQMRGGVLYVNGEAAALSLVDVHDGVDPSGEPVSVRLYDETLPGGCTYRVQHYDYADGRIEGQDDTFAFEVPDGHYFVMGDNRDASYDSRWQGRVGYVPAADVIGRAQFVFFSFGRDAAQGVRALRGERTLKALPCA